VLCNFLFGSAEKQVGSSLPRQRKMGIVSQSGARDGRFCRTRLMELEAERLTGAAHGERGLDRIAHRNGYRDRV